MLTNIGIPDSNATLGNGASMETGVPSESDEARCGTAMPRDRIDLLADQLRQCGEPRRLGALGERFAEAYLTRRGWRVVARNYRTRWGELDLICVDDYARVVFVEVKTRTGMGFGGPREAITQGKRRHLRQAAGLWMRSEPWPDGCHGVRFDVVGVLVERDGVDIDHIKGAFL